MKYLLIFLSIIISLNLVYASPCSLGVYPCDPNVEFNNPILTTTTTSSINYSTVNVNNSDYLDNIDSAGFCKLNYSNTGDIKTTGNVSAKNFILEGSTIFNIDLLCNKSNICFSLSELNMSGGGTGGQDNVSWNESYANTRYPFRTEVCYSNGTGCTAGGGGTTTIVQGQPLVIRQMNPLSTNNHTLWSSSDIQYNLVTGTRYYMICNLLYTGQATTTGLALNITNNATVSNVNINYDTWSSNTAKVGFSSLYFNTALTGTGSGAGVIYYSKVIADFNQTSDGVLMLWKRSEVSGSIATLINGSTCKLYNVTV